MSFLSVGLSTLILVIQCHASGLMAGPNNAVWAGSIFLRGVDPTTGEKLNDEKLKALAQRLKANGIRSVYLFSGPIQNDGKLPAYVVSDAALKSVSFLKKVNPELKIFSWLGGVQDKTVHIQKSEWRNAAVREITRLLMIVPFDGIHVDLEYIVFPKKDASALPLKSYDSGWLEFHRQLRTSLPHALISTTVVTTASGTIPWKHKHSLTDVTSVSRIVNQIAFMFYDTHIESLAAYRENIRLQLEQIKTMRSQLGDQAPEFLFGIGTFASTKALSPYRNMKFENLELTLSLLRAQLSRQAPKTKSIDGLAIYSDWTTNLNDWQKIQNFWKK